MTFSPSPYGEHATAFGGYGKQPPLKVIQQIAIHANFANWKEAQFAIAEIVESIDQFTLVARELGVSNETITLITQQLNQVYQDNKGLL